MARIVLDNCSYSYSSHREDKTITGFSLTVEAGSFVSIIGPNGSGKSTLAKLLNGIYVPTEGCVTVDGLDTREKNNIGEIRRKVAILFQNPDNQIVGDTVEDDVAFGPENLGLESDEITRRVESSLKKVGLFEKRRLSPNTLSGGEKAKVFLAGIEIFKPDMILMDEPTNHLDMKGRAQLYDFVQKTNSATVIVSHDRALLNLMPGIFEMSSTGMQFYPMN